MTFDKTDAENAGLFNRIATDWSDPESVLREIESQKRRARPEAEGDYVAPRNPVEGRLAALCAEVLGVERVGAHDNFFKLGGNSILATQLLSRVQDAFQVEVPLHVLFEVPTVATLAVNVIQGQAGQADADEMEQLLAELEAIPDELPPDGALPHGA